MTVDEHQFFRAKGIINIMVFVVKAFSVLMFVCLVYGDNKVRNARDVSELGLRPSLRRDYVPPNPGYHYPDPGYHYPIPTTTPKSRYLPPIPTTPSVRTYVPPNPPTTPRTYIPPNPPTTSRSYIPPNPPTTSRSYIPPGPPTTPRSYIPDNMYIPQTPDQHHEHGTPYVYSYQVQDGESGNFQSRQTQSDGDVEKGEYRVLLPDGREQVVMYTADWKHGFHADVSYVDTGRRIVDPTPKPYLPPGYHY